MRYLQGCSGPVVTPLPQVILPGGLEARPVLTMLCNLLFALVAPGMHAWVTVMAWRSHDALAAIITGVGFGFAELYWFWRRVQAGLLLACAWLLAMRLHGRLCIDESRRRCPAMPVEHDIWPATPFPRGLDHASSARKRPMDSVARPSAGTFFVFPQCHESPLCQNQQARPIGGMPVVFD